MAKFNQNQSYIFNLHAYIEALANGHFDRLYNTVWTAFNKATDGLIYTNPTSGKDIKTYFQNVAANYPGTGTRGATDAGACNAGRHISALVKLGILVPVAQNQQPNG